MLIFIKSCKVSINVYWRPRVLFPLSGLKFDLKFWAFSQVAAKVLAAASQALCENFVLEKSNKNYSTRCTLAEHSSWKMTSKLDAFSEALFPAFCTAPFKTSFVIYDAMKFIQQKMFCRVSDKLLSCKENKTLNLHPAPFGSIRHHRDSIIICSTWIAVSLSRRQ